MPQDLQNRKKLQLIRQSVIPELRKGRSVEQVLQDLFSSISVDEFSQITGLSNTVAQASLNHLEEEPLANILLAPLELELRQGVVTDLRFESLKQQIIVVDDFYQEPLKVRQFAIEQEYDKPERDDGTERRSLNSVNALRLPEADMKLRRILGCDFIHHTSSGMFRISPETGVRTGLHIHVDVYGWNGILYLNLPEQCRGGTTLYRHIETGIERGPTPREKKDPVIADQFEELRKDFRDDSKWEVNMHIPMRFNRLVLIKGNLLHSRSSHFGTTTEDARLTQVFFLQTLND